MKLRRAKKFYVIRPCENPVDFLESRTTFPHEADKAWYIPLHEGNLLSRVQKHIGGKFNVPNPEENYVPRLISEYEKRLLQGQRLFQFLFEGYIYYETFNDEKKPNRPKYEHVNEVPKSWLTVQEAAKDKDIDKSTVNSKIYAGNLHAVMMNGRRYIEPTNEYKKWSPDRKKSYLRDRRLIIAMEVLKNFEPIHLQDFYDHVVEIESRRFGDEQIPKSIESFFNEVLEGVGEVPSSIWVWYNRIDSYVEFFDLETQVNRAYPDNMLDEVISSAK